MSRKVIKGSAEIVNKIKLGPSESQGYWQARGFMFPSAETIMEVPYHDFHENGSKEGAKKNLIGVPNQCKTSVQEMEQAYTGVLLTQTRAIPNGFFMYSAAIMHTYMTFCELSSMLGCKPEKNEIDNILNSGVLPDELVEKLYFKLYSSIVALEICTRTFYEGSGSLGGYKDKVWLLWGRLSKTACPTSDAILSQEQAEKDYKAYNKASHQSRLLMFTSWFNEAYGDEFKNAVGKDDLGFDTVCSSVSVLFECWEWIKTYKACESGFDGFDFNDENMDLEEAQFYVKAISAGVFRRLSKGITESSFSDYNEAQHLSVSMTNPVFEVIFTKLFSGHNGLCSFGEWLLSANEIACQRIDMYEDEEVDKFGEKKKATKFRNVD